ncbi:MAG: ISAs1 family transposase, partial [Aestuariibacter sp.]|nr:ISAs1 family transposase [Aestuariibacter sp.]
MLALSGCIVTIDAMGCQKEIANKIIDKGADYVLALKGNQSNLHKDVRRLFDFALDIGFVDYDYHKTVDKKSHGRHEIRHCWTISDPASLGNVRNVSAWQKLQTIVMVKSERTSGKKTTTESRYFISSLAGDAQQTLAAVREHWHIENQLHWILDVAFAEDSCRVRKENGPQNFAVLRHIAMNLLTQEDTAKCGIQAKRKKAGWDNNYMLKVLSGFT